MDTHVPISPPFWASLPSSLSHPRDHKALSRSRSSQSTEPISLCYAAASHQPTILHLVVYICQCYSHFTPSFALPPHVLKSILYVYLFIPALQLGSSVFGWFFFFFGFHIYICVSIQYLFFSLWLTSLCRTDSRSIHLTTNNSISFLLWLSNIPLYTCATSSLSIHLSMDT